MPDPPLTGLRVVDLSRVLAGPYCTMVLADLGADVIKVERPQGGDETRAWGPPFAGGESAYYLSVNRGKRSCAIDLSHEDGRAIALELCDRADVVIENFKTGGSERLGLGYETLRERNPKLVHCSVTGFGSDREPADRPGYDFVAQAESGLMSITGFDAPTKVGVAVVDVLAGLNSAIAVLAALHSGEGGHVEVPLLDAGMAALVNQALNALVTGEDPVPRGNAHPNIVPYEDFATADGRLVLAAANDGLFRRLCDALGRSELADDPRFATNPARVVHRDELKPELERSLAGRSADEWVDALGLGRRAGREGAHDQRGGRGGGRRRRPGHRPRRRTPPPVRWSWCGRRSAPRCASRPRRRCWASTPGRSSASWAAATTRSRASPSAARSPCRADASRLAQRTVTRTARVGASPPVGGCTHRIRSSPDDGGTTVVSM